VRYSVVIWDFDGTLADTLPLWLAVYNREAVHNGWQVIDDPQQFRDLPMQAIPKQLKIPWWRVPLLMRSVLASQSRLMGSVSLFPGIHELLASCQARRIMSGIVSTNTVENVRRCLGVSDATRFFEFIEGSSGLLAKKRALRRALRRHALDRRQIVYVGDEVRDIVAARGTGIDVAAVTWGLNSSRMLRQHDPTYLVDDTGHLESVLLTGH
jgi:phosphoglycolate phosphatase